MKLSNEEKKELKNLVEGTPTPSKMEKNFNRYEVKGKSKCSLLEGEGEIMEQTILIKIKSDVKIQRLEIWLGFIRSIILIIILLISILITGTTPAKEMIELLKNLSL